MRRLVVSVGALLALGACVSTPVGDTDTTPAPVDAAPALVDGPLRAISTSGDQTGNRYHEGRGSLPGEPVVVPGDRPIEWVVAAEAPDGLVVVAVADDGSVRGHLLTSGVVTPYELNMAVLPMGAPPALVVNEGVLLLGPPAETGSVLTSPLAMGSGGLAFVTNDGAVVVAGPAGNRRFNIDPLPDTRLVVSSAGQLAALTQPTDRYPHGIAGDRLEAAAVDVIDLATLEVTASATIPEERVVEGVSPMWVDLDGDGIEELVLTVSDSAIGSRLVTLSAGGTFGAESDPIGQGSRWRHQIGVGPMGIGGETELVDVRTPHIGGIVEFFALDGDRLVMTASLPGYSSHAIGSRNLDQALLADANADGVPEVVVPHQSRTSLGGVQRSANGAAEVWSYDLGSTITSNLAGVSTANGRFVLIAGLSDGRLLVWP